MFPNLIRYEARALQRSRSAAIYYEQLSKFVSKTNVAEKFAQMKNRIYERAIGQHLFKSTSVHHDPCRYGDFEAKGRASDF